MQPTSSFKYPGMHVLISVLLITLKNWGQHKCQTVQKQFIKLMIHVMAYYAADKNFVVERDLMAWDDVHNMSIIEKEADFTIVSTIGA